MHNHGCDHMGTIIILRYTLRDVDFHLNILFILCFLHSDFLMATELTSATVAESPESRLGFVMAMHYSDQMTGASANLMNLQCFFGHHLKDVRVVEPFLHPIGSTLGVSLSPSFDKLERQNMNTVKHSDVFDSGEWEKYSSSRKYAQLISWNDFMKTCPKKLIVVHHLYSSPKKDSQCDPKYMIGATQEFVTENRFEVVKQVCLNFQHSGVLSPKGLIKAIYGDFKANEVVVIFNRWGGLSSGVENFRLAVNDASCKRGDNIRLFHHSKQLLSDVNKYSSKYMNKAIQYEAVMVRLEYVVINRRLAGKPVDVQRKQITECFNDITRKAAAAKAERNITTVLLTMDVGKYGTIGFRKNNPRLGREVLDETVPKFLSDLMGESFSQSEWEDSFESVARFNAPGYIAIMQLELAARSLCLIQAGGGSFQATARTLHNELHRDSRCTLSAC